MHCNTTLYFGDQIMKTEMGSECSTFGERKHAYRVLVGKPERRRPLERPRRKWDNNIKKDLRVVHKY
jgi:hypothetical protein